MSNVAAYLYATNRKVRIAAYEHRVLIIMLERCGRPKQSPIPVQALFEGVITAGASAVDKLADSIRLGEREVYNHMIGRKPSDSTPLSWILSNVPKNESCFAQLRSWNSAPVVDFARRLRNDSVHKFYDKSGDGGDYVVASSDHPYSFDFNGAPITIQDLTRDLVAHLNGLFVPIHELCSRYCVDQDEWEERLESEND